MVEAPADGVRTLEEEGGGASQRDAIIIIVTDIDAHVAQRDGGVGGDPDLLPLGGGARQHVAVLRREEAAYIINTRIGKVDDPGEPDHPHRDAVVLAGVEGHAGPPVGVGGVAVRGGEGKGPVRDAGKGDEQFAGRFAGVDGVGGLPVLDNERVGGHGRTCLVLQQELHDGLPALEDGVPTGDGGSLHGDFDLGLGVVAVFGDVRQRTVLTGIRGAEVLQRQG